MLFVLYLMGRPIVSQADYPIQHSYFFFFLIARKMNKE